MSTWGRSAKPCQPSGCFAEEKEGDQHMLSVRKFLALIRDSGHPVTIAKTKEEFVERFKSYS